MKKNKTQSILLGRFACAIPFLISVIDYPVLGQQIRETKGKGNGKQKQYVEDRILARQAN